MNMNNHSQPFGQTSFSGQSTSPFSLNRWSENFHNGQFTQLPSTPFLLLHSSSVFQTMRTNSTLAPIILCVSSNAMLLSFFHKSKQRYFPLSYSLVEVFHLNNDDPNKFLSFVSIFLLYHQNQSLSPRSSVNPLNPKLLDTYGRADFYISLHSNVNDGLHRR